MHAFNLTDVSQIVLNENIIYSQNAKIDLYLEQYSQGMPLEYITQKCNFYGIDLYINNHVLIPRIDTEILVTETIKAISNKEANILDLCTGSGCIAISIAKHCKNTNILAVDISMEALDVCNKNIVQYMLQNQIKTKQADITTNIPKGNFNVIVSNPPYIATDVIPNLNTSVTNYEPHIALDGGTDGLKFYRYIFQYICNAKDIKAFLEIGFDQQESVTALAKSFGIEKFRIINDFACNPRLFCIDYNNQEP